MKTILRIVIILLVAAVVAGAFSLAVNNTTLTASGSNSASGQFQAQGTDSGQRPARPDGGEGAEGGASLGAGLLGLLVTLAKLAGIGALVLFLQKGISLLQNRKTSTISAA